MPVQAAANGQPTRPLDVIAPVALRHLSDVRLFAPGAERRVEVEVTAVRDRAVGALRTQAPDGWKISPASQPFRLASAGDREAARVHRQGPVRIRARPASRPRLTWATRRGAASGS